MSEATNDYSRPRAVVISIAGDSVQLQEAPFDLKGQRASAPFRFRKDSLLLLEENAPGIVRKCGHRLCTRIAKSEAIKTTLRLLAEELVSTKQTPLLVKVDDDAHENLPWEAIWSRGLEFLALGATAPVARLNFIEAGGQGCIREAEPILRVLAVLSVADSGVDVRAEWRALYRSLEKVRGRVRVHLITSSDALMRDIEALGDPLITCDGVSSAEYSLLVAVQEFRPNVVHFFCHGRTAPLPHLELATRRGTVQITTTTLQEIAAQKATWMIVLNSCHGAKRDGPAYSLARSIASMRIPAVVAMRQSIVWTDANRFTDAFYEVMMSALVRAADPALGPLERDFPADELMRAMRAARQRLKDADRGTPAARFAPDDSLEWTLPIVYLQRRARLQLRDSSELGASRNVQLSVVQRLGAMVEGDPAAAAFLKKLGAHEAGLTTPEAGRDADRSG